MPFDLLSIFEKRPANLSIQVTARAEAFWPFVVKMMPETPNDDHAEPNSRHLWGSPILLLAAFSVALGMFGGIVFWAAGRVDWVAGWLYVGIVVANPNATSAENSPKAIPR